jgi:2-oxoglutarate dehydrogenase E2 component (dihydrolipoamide succinyltransferase)
MSSVSDVIAPANQEGTKATVLKWCKSVGDSVARDEPLIELETDKVTVEIASPASGILTDILKQSDQEVIPGEVLGRITVGIADAAAAVSERPAVATPLEKQSPDRKISLSPSVRRLLAEHNLTSDDVPGSGRNGRITAQDVTRRAQTGGMDRMHASRPHSPPTANGSSPQIAGEALTRSGGSETPFESNTIASTRVPHTPIRRRIAEHMTKSLLEAPHVTTLFEADLTRVLAHRARHAADHRARGARLTLTAYIISACVRALRAIPEVNATFHEDALELHGDVNIGIGTALGNNGLIVPVIHRAQGLNLFGIARRLGELVEGARAGKLAPGDVRGGTFTISNHGASGSLLAAPIIINQPQVAILGVGKLQRRVCVVTVDGVESISVRSMCYLTLSIDHRALDAFQANAFLSHVVETLETWAEDAA